MFGVFLTWDAQRGKLVCRNARSLTSQPSVASVSPRPTDEARLTISDETVVNQWVIECTHERRDNKGKVELDYRDAASQQALGRVEKVEIKHPGIIPPDGDAAGYIAQFVQPLFLSRATLQRYARAATTITIPASKQHQIAAGDIVTYTASNQFPDPSGSGKLTAAVKALVTNSRWNYRRCEGILDIILYDAAADDVAPWGYAAIVDRSATSGGWDNTTKQLTLVAQIYSNGTNDDGAAIEEGHYVYVQESAPEDPTSITRWGPFEVDSDYETDGAQILTLVAGTTMAGFDTAGATEYVVVPADWDDASAAQQLAGTWQADATDEDLGSGSDDPQRWG